MSRMYCCCQVKDGDRKPPSLFSLESPQLSKKFGYLDVQHINKKRREAESVFLTVLFRQILPVIPKNAARRQQGLQESSAPYAAGMFKLSLLRALTF